MIYTPMVGDFPSGGLGRPELALTSKPGGRAGIEVEVELDLHIIKNDV